MKFENEYMDPANSDKVEKQPLPCDYEVDDPANLKLQVTVPDDPLDSTDVDFVVEIEGPY